MSGDPGWVKHGAGPDAATGIDADRLAVTDGTLLGGRVAYRQYRGFHRTGIEPVLMAAAVPATAGDRVLEAGCGAGAGLLCLAARVAGLSGVGIELDAAMARLSDHNLCANGLDWPILRTPVQEVPGRSDADAFHHAFANPPWHRAASTRSPDQRRDLARRAQAGTLRAWTAALAAQLRRGGTLTLALPAFLHAEAGGAMLEAGFGAIAMLPFWPKPDRPARIILLQGVLGGRGDGIVLPGLVLHRHDNHFTDEAEAVLRHGAPLPMRREPGRQASSKF